MTAEPRRRPFLRIAFGIASTAAVAYVFWHERDLFTGFVGEMARIRWPWVAASLAAEILSIVPLAEAQRLVLRVAGTEAPRWGMVQATFASNAIAMSVPAGVAFAEGYYYARYRDFGAGKAEAAYSELASGAIAFAALASVALAGAILAGGPAYRILVPVLCVVLAGSLGATALFRRPHLLVRAIEGLDRLVGKRLGDVVDRATERIRETATSLKDIHPSVALWGTAFGLSLVNWALDVICLGLAFVAVGVPVPWGATLLAFAGGKVVSSLGITPGGLGLVEGGLVATFVAYGVKGSEAGAAVLLYRAITLVGLVGLGWVAVGLLAARRPARRNASTART